MSAALRVEDTAFDGVKKVWTRHLTDPRGFFSKTIHADVFRENGMRFDFAEEYYSVSKKNVLRGLHFQTPPHDHAKYVTCLTGEVLDVIVDLRRGSKTYGKTEAFKLSESAGMSLYLPTGFAHGFLALTENAMMLYRVTSVYAPSNDAGILWSSIDFKWPVETPIVSDRDAAFPRLVGFNSPFMGQEV